MYEAYVAKFLRTKWATITNIGTVIPGDLHYGRKVGSGSTYAKFTISTQKVETISDNTRHGTYSILLEVYSKNTNEADILAIAAILDIQTSATSSLMAVLLASRSGAISSGAGTPGGALIEAWRVSPPTSESLQTEDERQAGCDIHVTRMGLRLRVQWGN